jgi:hypothetical protein
MSETEFKSKFSFRLESLVFHGPAEIGGRGGSTFSIITEIGGDDVDDDGC